MRAAMAGLTLALAMAAPLPAQTAPPGKLAASVRRIFGEGARLDTLRPDSATVLRVSRGDSLLGYAQVRNARGKDQPITYLVAVEPGGRLRDVDILVYREPYGGEVAYEPWRQQFRGKGPDDALVVGRDIKGVSGATISVNAVTTGVRRAVADFASWHHRGLLR
jgi:transcriptional regulator of nitric oxide reductase